MVWALRSRTVFADVNEFIERQGRDQGFDTRVELVEAPYRDNPRLAAQKGCFTLVVHRTPREEVDYRIPSIETVLKDYERHKYQGKREADGWPLARCLTLPHTEARKLLRILGEAGFNAAAVYPDYEGARIGSEEIEFWE